MAEATSDLDPVSVFSLLGDETRLAILRTLYAETRKRGTGRGTVAYSTLREAVGEPDSGKFNYHLSRLTGHFVEKFPGGYALREPGKEVVRALRQETITRSPAFGPAETDAACPRCGGAVRVSYTNEHVFAHCVDCVGLLEFEYIPAGTLLAVTLPPAGAAARDLSTLLAPATLRFEHRLKMMAGGVCPECGGTVTRTLRECEGHRHTASTTCDRCHTAFGALLELGCETCERRRIAPPAFVLTDRCPVAEALAAAGADDAWERYAEVSRWPATLRGDEGARELVYTPTAGGARVVVGADCSVRREPLHARDESPPPIDE